MAEELQERYLYTVNPKRAIRNLTENIPILRTSRSLYLTKEEVLKCLEAGTVYRRFSRYNKMEKITKYDIDRVHRDTYITKEDWNKMEEQSKKVENLNVNGNEEVKPVLGRGTTRAVQYTFVEEEVAEPIKEELVEVSTEETIEAPVDELPTSTSGYVDEVKEEVEELPMPETFASVDTVEVEVEDNTASEEISEEINEDTQEGFDIDESEEDEVVEDENSPVVDTEFKSNSSVVVNYNSGKKKKHKH